MTEWAPAPNAGRAGTAWDRPEVLALVEYVYGRELAPHSGPVVTPDGESYVIVEWGDDDVEGAA